MVILAVFIRKSIPLLWLVFSQDLAYFFGYGLFLLGLAPGRLYHRHLQAECLQRTLLKYLIKTKRQAHAPVLVVILAVFIRKSIPLLRFAFSQDHALFTDWVFSCRAWLREGYATCITQAQSVLAENTAKNIS